MSITPSAPEYRAKESVTTDKTTDLEPSDRAWPRMVVFKGHVYLGRNTTSGPQLWRCDPGHGFGQPSLHTRFGDAASVASGGHGFLYVPVSGGPGTPVRLYRQRD